MSEVTIPHAFALALQHHQAGRLADAEALCRQILAAQPREANALHLLGIIAQQTGRHDLAVESLRKSTDLDPNNAATHSNLGEACRALGWLDEAVACYRRALELNPHDALAQYNLGLALGALGRVDEAVGAYRRALVSRPEFAEAHNNLGSALRDLGRLDEAVAAYQHALALQPEYAEAHNNLGNALRDQGRLEAALAAYRRALQLKPGYPEAQNNLGNALQEQGRLPEAMACYRRALDLRPAYPEAHNNLGNLLRKLGQLDEAITAYDRALAIQPGYGEAWFNLGNVRKDRGELDASIAAFRRAVQLLPARTEARSSLLFMLHYLPDLDEKTRSEEQARWNREVSEPLRPFILPHRNARHPERRLRVGYVSPDFRDHVAGRNFRPLLRGHDRANFDVICYSGVTQPDYLTDELRRQAGEWRSTVGLTDEALAAMIRQDGVDILVDLAQHTGGNRLPVFARRPAPVQVSFVGYPAGTGLEAIEYRISDRWLEADASQSDPHFPFVICHRPFATQEQVFLIDSFWCYDPCGTETGVNPLPARKSGHVTFGSLNNFCKVNDPVLQLWARVLGRVKDSRLILLSPGGSHRQRTLAFLEREGVVADRVEFVGPLPRRAYLELYHRLDVALDPFPYNGHTTSLDALWMGVPVVSLVGIQPVSRGGWSQLSNLRLAKLAASSEDDYVEIAVQLTHDLPRLAELRATLRARMEASVLMDAPRFARQVETGYRAMWRQWCAE